MDNPKNGETFAWLLERVTDASGNWIQYAYTGVGNVKYPSAISWAQAGASANRFVTLARAARTDAALDYTAGFRQQVDERLAGIEVHVDSPTGPLVTRYALGYAQSPDSGRSLLATVQRVGSNGTTALPPHEFSYSTSSHAFTVLANPHSFSRDPGSPRPVQAGLTARHKGSVDLDGDALLDYVNVDQTEDANSMLVDGRTYWDRNQGRLTFFSSGSYAYLTDAYPELSGVSAHLQRSWSFPSCSGSDTCSGLDQQLVDFTGDGLADFLEAPDAAPCSWTLRPGTGDGAFGAAIPWLNVPAHPGAGSPAKGRCSATFSVGDALAPDQVVTLVDLNGDRLPDRVFSNTAGAGYWQVALNLGLDSAGTSLSFGAQRTWAEASARDLEAVYAAHLVDINGDGLVDRIFRTGVCCAFGGWQVEYNYGAGFEAPEALAADFAQSYDPSHYFVDRNVLRDPRAWGLIVDVLDVNGDGLPDRYGIPQVTGGGGYDGVPLVWFGTGTGFQSAAIEWANGAFGSEVVRQDEANYPSYPIEMRDYDGDGLVDRAYRSLRPFDGTVLLNVICSPNLAHFL